jgi:hypothetical protein
MHLYIQQIFQQIILTPQNASSSSVKTAFITNFWYNDDISNDYFSNDYFSNNYFSNNYCSNDYISQIDRQRYLEQLYLENVDI